MVALAAATMLEEALPVFTYGVYLFEDALFELICRELLVPKPDVVDPAR